jgi:CDP-glucose 4,6-dehydratase
VRSVVMVTSDKCYRNNEWVWGYRETDELGGDDPYSASKACAEHAIRAYTESFFRRPGSAAVASVRAGNVVGGGDWSPYRLVPDCIRSLREDKTITLRNPDATRPWQFVLDPLAGYMRLAVRLWEEGPRFAGAWNFGPPADNTNTVERGAREIVSRWGAGQIEVKRTSPFQEHALLQLDCTKARELLAWRPQVGFRKTMELTADWYKAQHASADKNMFELSCRQIRQFEELMTQGESR